MSGKYKAKKQQPASSRFTLGKGKWLALALAIVSIGGVLLWLVSRGNRSANFTPEVEGAPSVSVSQDRLDYGEVKIDTPVEAVFQVRNVGDQPLTILGEPQLELVEGC
jgi:hypothetical protein